MFKRKYFVNQNFNQLIRTNILLLIIIRGSVSPGTFNSIFRRKLLLVVVEVSFVCFICLTANQYLMGYLMPKFDTRNLPLNGFNSSCLILII